MGRLWKDPVCRELALFPLCFRQDDQGEGNSETPSYGIVFQRLHDFRIGLPADRDLRQQFLDKVEMAMVAMHGMGVVHLDWYLSNFMWKSPSLGEGQGGVVEVVVKIIDFDSAHFVGPMHSHTMNKEITRRLSGRRSKLANREKEGGSANIFNYDISLMKLLRMYSDNERLQSASKAVLDDVFLTLQEQEVG